MLSFLLQESKRYVNLILLYYASSLLTLSLPEVKRRKEQCTELFDSLSKSALVLHGAVG